MDTQAKPDLLIVDDDPLITDTLNFVLSKDYTVYAADSRNQVKSLLRQLDKPPQLALIDLGLPPTPHRPDEGFRLINELLAYAPGIKIVVLSGQNDEANARHARTLGAIEFIPKPCEPEKLKSLLAKALQIRDVELVVAPAEGGIIGKSSVIEKLRNQIGQYANAPFPVLIEGESGSGKELVAISLHSLSGRKQKPYLALNCAAISPNLVEPTLFGYCKGSFTGATASHSGYFEDAKDGTLFLDEIGELPLELQAKLLRVLENGEYQRVGETTNRTSNARVVAATNRDLQKMVDDGKFREDLWFRLNVVRLKLPPLRERRIDIPLLAQFFVAKYNARYSQDAKLLESGLKVLQDFTWPGNVRQMQHLIERLTILAPGGRIDAEAVQDAVAASETRDNGGDTLADAEGDQIRRVMAATGGNKSRAASILGIERKTLYRKLERMKP